MALRFTYREFRYLPKRRKGNIAQRQVRKISSVCEWTLVSVECLYTTHGVKACNQSATVDGNVNSIRNTLTLSSFGGCSAFMTGPKLSSPIRMIISMIPPVESWIKVQNPVLLEQSSNSNVQGITLNLSVAYRCADRLVFRDLKNDPTILEMNSSKSKAIGNFRSTEGKVSLPASLSDIELDISAQIPAQTSMLNFLPYCS